MTDSADVNIDGAINGHCSLTVCAIMYIQLQYCGHAGIMLLTLSYYLLEIPEQCPNP